MNDDVEERLANEWYDEKSSRMEEILGKEHDLVMHAIIPYAIGGTLDLYYYPNGIPGTGIATKELSDSPDEGSTNDQFDLYEMVMFTRHNISLDDAKDDSTDFGAIHTTINVTLNQTARYSAQATLNPNETCEFPEDMDVVGGNCLIFDAYNTTEHESSFGMLVLIQIYRTEMEYAQEYGGAALLDRLKSAGYYPYSDMEREPVA